MFVGASLLGRQALKGAYRGALTLSALAPQRKIWNRRAMLGLLFYLESMLNTVWLGPKLAPTGYGAFLIPLSSNQAVYKTANSQNSPFFTDSAPI